MPHETMLRYHADAARLLGVSGRVAGDAVAEIARAEAACGRALPAAVREYYALADADELLTLEGDACGAIPRSAFLAKFVRAAAGEGVEFFGPRRVNTGYQAYVTLDGSDDPPVDADGAAGPVPFSEYVYLLARYKVTGEFG